MFLPTPRCDFHSLTRRSSAQIAALSKDPGVVILPIGAVEQHGPHLPLHTDCLVAEAVLERTLGLLPEESPVWVLPTLAYTKSNEHVGFAGTIALKATTLIETLTQVAENLAQSGFKRLVLLNGHGGNPAVLDIVARDVRQLADLLVFPVTPFRLLGDLSHLFDPEELRFGIHAGDFETSILLAIAPEQVQVEAYIAELPAVRKSLNLLDIEGGLGFGWLTSDLSKSGVLGDPRPATAAKGEEVLDLMAQKLAPALLEICAFSLPQPG
ncbi:creatininase family protein [Leptolyngbya sp. FACHB-261]|uniref:creatininase family protein n=1 Tax=Leptolyngbya sp. FACHB-261 TaxID=2692806 RepID=UPI001686CFF5|nr:creatininase family protein [Leptolyngbya sp. FACHB-261]MBD2100770.1 creatininase family protein [Leptolyngbya sp. FACHB-261]